MCTGIGIWEAIDFWLAKCQESSIGHSNVFFFLGCSHSGQEGFVGLCSWWENPCSTSILGALFQSCHHSWRLSIFFFGSASVRIRLGIHSGIWIVHLLTIWAVSLSKRKGVARFNSFRTHILIDEALPQSSVDGKVVLKSLQKEAYNTLAHTHTERIIGRLSILTWQAISAKNGCHHLWKRRPVSKQRFVDFSFWIQKAKVFGLPNPAAVEVELAGLSWNVTMLMQGGEFYAVVNCYTHRSWTEMLLAYSGPLMLSWRSCATILYRPKNRQNICQDSFTTWQNSLQFDNHLATLMEPSSSNIWCFTWPLDFKIRLWFALESGLGGTFWDWANHSGSSLSSDRRPIATLFGLQADKCYIGFGRGCFTDKSGHWQR